MKRLLSGFVLSYFLIGGVGFTALANPKPIEVTLTDAGLTPSIIIGKLDQPISLHIVNKGRHPHQLSIGRFYIFTRTLQPGESSDVSFAPYESGMYDVISDPVGDGVGEFHGKLNVLP